MKFSLRTRLGLLYLAVPAALAALATGCGGGAAALGSGNVANVNGEEVTLQQLNDVIKSVEQRNKAQGQQFPAAGSQEYQTLQQNALQFLVLRIELEQKAKELGVLPTKADVDQRLAQFKKQYFGGSDKRYRDALKQQGATDGEVRDQFRSDLISERLDDKVSASILVTDTSIRQYYKSHPEFSAPSRDVRHILVKSKALADRLYKQLKGGADFAALARKYSIDPGSKTLGGKLTVTKGQFVKPFENAAFSLKTNGISKPVKSTYGWHVIQALGPVKPAQPLAKVRETIRQTLLSLRKADVVRNFLSDVKKEYESKITYAPGFAPASTATTPTQTG